MIGGKRIVTNAFFLMASSVFNLALSLYTTTIIARSIGPDLYGRYTFGLNFILIFSILAHFGLESLFIREAARDAGKMTLMGDIFRMKVILAFGTALVTLFAAHLLEYPRPTLLVLYILAPGLVFQILSESLLSMFRALEQMAVPAAASMLFRLISAGIITASIFGGAGFHGVVSAYTIGNGLVLLWLLVMLRGRVPLQLPPGFIGRAFALARQGAPFYQAALLTMFYAKINIILLSKYSTESEMGYYMAGLTLVENLYFIPTAVITALFPAFSRVHGAAPDALRDSYGRIMRYVTILVVAVAAGTVLVGGGVVTLIFGDRFLPAVPVLDILIFFWVFTFFSQTQSSILFSTGRERVQVRIMAIACVLNLSLSWVLLDTFGYLGAAVAFVATECAVVAITSAVLWKTGYCSRPRGAFIFRLACALTGMALATWALQRVNLFAAIIAGGVAYLLGLFLFRVLDDQDRRYLAEVLSRVRRAVP